MLNPSNVGRPLAIGVLLLSSLAHGDTATARDKSSALQSREAKVDKQTLTEPVEAFAASVSTLRERLATSGPATPETVADLRRVAVALEEFRDYELADGVWNLIRVASSEVFGPCDPRVAEAIARLGGTAKYVAPLYDDILPYLREADSMLDPSVPEQHVLMARIHRSEAFYYWYRDRVRSIDMFEEALQIQESEIPGPYYDKTLTRAWLGWTLLQLGRHDEARAQLRLAQAELEVLGLSQVEVAGTIESALADLEMISGHWERAENGYRQAVQGYARKRRDGSTRFSEYPLHGYNLIALTQLKQGQPNEAWRSLQYYRGVIGKRLHSLREWQQRAPESYTQVRKLRSQVMARRDLRRGLDHAHSLSEVNWDAVIAELDANAHLFCLERDYYAPDVARTTEVAELQSVLPDNYAYIGWLESKVGDELINSPGKILDCRWMYIVRSRGPVQWIPIWEGTSVAEQDRLQGDAGVYGEMMRRATAWTLRVDDDPKLRQLSRRIATWEFIPALPYLKGVDHLVAEFFEDRVANLPLDALVLPDGTYVGDHYAVSYSPSADAFVASCRAGASHHANGRVLAIGDPIFRAQDDGKLMANLPTGSASVSGPSALFDKAMLRAATNGDRAALDALPRLPHAGTEIKNLQAAFPQCVTLRGNDATEANVERLFEIRDKPSAYQIIHFATHAMTATPLGQRNALALSRRGVDQTPSNDGLLDGLEIQLSWNLDADLVTLSGCQTVAADNWLRGEPVGLATTLLGVGARSVLANMWQVDDLASAYLMSRFYENLSGKNGMSKGDGRDVSRAVALAEAKQWLRNYQDDSGRKPFANPVYWSGFILIGAPQ